MNTPKLSVLMPAYNAEKYIAEAIESILNQTFTDFEFIIVDDGSTDGTWGIIQQYAERDGRVMGVKNEKNLGISATRNKLVRLANGEFAAWQDADDISLPYRMEKQITFMEQNPDVGLCGGSLEFFDQNGTMNVRTYETEDALLRKNIFRYSPVAQPAAMLRKRFIQEENPFDASLSQAEDLDLSFRMGRVSKFANLKEVVLKYRFNEGSVTVRKLRDNIRQTLLVRRRACDMYGYRMSVMDKLVYCVTSIFQYVPPKVTYFVFNLFRNEKNMKKDLKKGKVLLLGSFGQTNLGDDLLMDNFVSYLERLGAQEIIVNTNEPDNIPSSLKTRVSVLRTYETSVVVWLKTIVDVDVIVYGGGTIYKELYKTTGRTKYAVIVRMFLFNLTARFLRTPIVHLNIGIGSLKTRIGRCITKYGLTLANLTIFRDKDSYEFAKHTLGISDNKIYLGVDGLFLDGKWNQPKTGSTDSSSKKIGLNLLSDIPDWIDRSKYLEEIRAFVNYLLERGHKVTFIPFQTKFNLNNDAEFFRRDINPHIEKGSVEVRADVSIANIIDIYRDMDICIGMRFHSLVLAVATNTPFLAVEYDTKCTRFSEEMNYRYALKLEDASKPALVTIFNDLLNDIPVTVEKISQSREALFAAARSMDKADILLGDLIRG